MEVLLIKQWGRSCPCALSCCSGVT